MKSCPNCGRDVVANPIKFRAEIYAMLESGLWRWLSFQPTTLDAATTEAHEYCALGYKTRVVHTGSGLVKLSLPEEKKAIVK